MFVHRRGSIVDTTTADPHYNLVSDNKHYVSADYDFQDSRAVSKFWFDLQCICLNTPLGIGRGVRASGGEWPILDPLQTKKPLKDCLTPLDPFNPDTQSVAFRGGIPGDGRGAGGLDSSFYAHMKRNWTWLHLETEDYRADSKGRRTSGKTKKPVTPDEEKVFGAFIIL